MSNVPSAPSLLAESGRRSGGAARAIRWTVGVVLYAVAAASWPASSPRSRPNLPPKVTVAVSGSGPGSPATLIVLAGRPTVADVLAVSTVHLAPAHLLTARLHQPIAGRDVSPTLLLNGRPVALATPVVGQRNVLQVIEPQDHVETVVFQPATAVAAAAVPRVMRKLWHPGTPGHRSEVWMGAVSDEMLSAVSDVPPIPPAPVTEKLVALTFDDGPWPDTAQFLAVLRAADVKATFCMIGSQVLSHPDWVRAVAAAGMLICNHTMNHDERLDRESPAKVASEVQGGADAITQVLGHAPRYYRPPGGTLSLPIEDAANALGEQVLHWSVDPSDWKRPGVDKIVAAVISHVSPGAIVGLHDGGGDRSQTLAALPIIIQVLKSEGYDFTTPDAVSPNHQ